MQRTIFLKQGAYKGGLEKRIDFNVFNSTKQRFYGNNL